MLTLKLTEKEVIFIYQMLDQVSVPGLAQKKIVVNVMDKLEKIIPKDEDSSGQKTK